MEQVETPAALAARNAATGSKDKVVARAPVVALTAGTLCDAAQTESHPEAAPLVVVVEAGHPGTAPGRTLLAVAACDAASGRFSLGAFSDDACRGRLRALLSRLRPAEVAFPRDALPPPTLGALGAAAPTAVRRPVAPPYAAGGEAAGVVAALQASRPFGDPPAGGGAFDHWPRPLGDAAAAATAGGGGCAGGARAVLCLTAFGVLLRLLRDAALDAALLPMRQWEALDEAEEDAREEGRGAGAGAAAAGPGPAPPRYVRLDAAALEGLEVLCNSEGGAPGSLLASLNAHAVTQPGKRVLRAWLCRPLADVDAIVARQQCVGALKGCPEARFALRAALARAPDLERSLARLCALARPAGRNAPRVVLYESSGSAKRAAALIALLTAAAAAADAAAAVGGALRDAGAAVPRRLADMLDEAPPRGGEGWDDAGNAGAPAAPAAPPPHPCEWAALPSVSPLVARFRGAFDWDAARRAGAVAPRPGAEPAEVLAAAAAVAAAGREADAWLGRARVALRDAATPGVGALSITRPAAGGLLLEVPDRVLRHAPPGWPKASSKKGFTRFEPPELRAIGERAAAAAADAASAADGVCGALVARCAALCGVWGRCAASLARLDALCALAAASAEAEAAGPVCTPVFVAAAGAAGAVGGAARAPAPRATFAAAALRHPCAPALGGGCDFVANDLALGGDGEAGAGRPPPVLLLTGPNMGGKSTLLRCAGLAALLAHAGGDVPARACVLSPLDALYVRMGAKDDLAGGRSTFATELEETGASAAARAAPLPCPLTRAPRSAARRVPRLAGSAGRAGAGHVHPRRVRNRGRGAGALRGTALPHPLLHPLPQPGGRRRGRRRRGAGAHGLPGGRGGGGAARHLPVRAAPGRVPQELRTQRRPPRGRARGGDHRRGRGGGAPRGGAHARRAGSSARRPRRSCAHGPAGHPPRRRGGGGGGGARMQRRVTTAPAQHDNITTSIQNVLIHADTFLS